MACIRLLVRKARVVYTEMRRSHGAHLQSDLVRLNAGGLFFATPVSTTEFAGN